jgi:large subunit ribosomal protein L29
MLNMNEVKEWSEEQLKTKVAELRKTLFEVRVAGTTSGIEKPHRIKFMKRDIAKCLTALNARK